MTTTDATYEAAWRHFSRLQGALILCVAFFPLCFIAVNVVVSGLAVPPAFAKVAIWGSWFVAFAVASFRYTYFRCPRCSERYFMKFPCRNQFARRCLHCGLPKWAVNDGQP